jgi:ComF family protein
MSHLDLTGRFAALAALRRLGAATVDLLLPPRCIGCGALGARHGELCAACWGALRFIQAPYCRCCGLPLPHSAVGEPLCGACAAEPPPYDRARAALAYDDASRELVLAFKHRERLAGLDLFAAWMRVAGAELLADADLVAPVPLHRWRLLRRGFNQAALLAARVAGRGSRIYCPDLLVRSRATPSQQGLGEEARLRNVTAAVFSVRRRHRARVDGARVVLVDDVMTTGATVGACAIVLRRAGAAQIDVLCLARVIRAGPVAI